MVHHMTARIVAKVKPIDRKILKWPVPIERDPTAARLWKIR